MTNNRSRLRRALAPALFAIVGSGAVAQDASVFPSRTLQIVVPYTVGASADILARLVGPKLAERWNVAVVTDNRPGASSSIGIAYAAKAAADGHTLMFVATSFGMLPALQPKQPFDPIKSFAAVGIAATSALSLVVHPVLPVRSVSEFVRLAKRRPADLHYSSPGNGTPQHLVMELFKLETGLDIVHVPYRGLAPAISDLVGGHVQVMIPTLQTIHPHVQGGKLRMLAVLSAARSATFPAVPTLREQGLPQLEVETWYGALVPAGTPAAVIAKLNTEINNVLQQPAIGAQLIKLGMQPTSGTPERFDALIKSELARWSRVVTAAKIKPD
jgi:tripartite-type tricarboxylate transporter receptor subunit TctC